MTQTNVLRKFNGKSIKHINKSTKIRNLMQWTLQHIKKGSKINLMI